MNEQDKKMRRYKMNHCCDCIYYIRAAETENDEFDVDEFWNLSSYGWCDLGSEVTGIDECFGKEDACSFFKEKRKENKNDNI